MSDLAAPTALATLIDYQPAAIVSRVLLKQKTGNVTLFAFDAGQELSEHTAPFDALVQLVDGAAVIHIDRQPHSVTAGQILLLPAGIPHAVKAVSQMKMLLTMIRPAT